MNPRRDEGGARLAPLRALLRAAARCAGFEQLLSAVSRASIGAMLAPRSAAMEASPAEVAQRQALHRSLLALGAEQKPRICLLSPSAKVLTIKDADALDEAQRVACVPLRKQPAVVLRDALPGAEAAPPKVVVTWPSGRIAGGAQDATLVVERAGDGLRLCLTSCKGEKTNNLLVPKVPAPPMEQLLKPAAVELELAAQLPLAAGELPNAIKVHLANFLQTRLRLQCLFTASAPERATRPVALDSARAHRLEAGGKSRVPRLVVDAVVHASSASCVCEAHNLPSVESRFKQKTFSGRSEVAVTFEVCGLPMGEDGCSLHASGARNPLAPGVCCEVAGVRLHCRHQTVDKDVLDNVDGLSLQFNRMGPATWRLLTAILASVAEYERKSKPLFGEGAPADRARRLQKLVARTERVLAERVAEWERTTALDKKNHRSDAELLDLDMVCVDLLREGGVSQADRKQENLPRLHRAEGGELTVKQKQLHRFHHGLFPRFGQPAPKRKCGTLADLAPASPAPSGSSSNSGEKKQRRDPRYSSEEMVEYVDVRGLREIRSQLDALVARPDLPASQRERATLFYQYLNVVDNAYGPEEDGPLGLPARPLRVEYRARNDGGRLYPSPSTPQAPGFGKKDSTRAVCIQGMPREMRPFLCCRWGHDYDMKNAQPRMLHQMPRRLTWPEERAPLDLQELGKWCTDRDEFIDHVAEVHALPTDESRWHEFRKDAVKQLMIRLMFGGQYDAWIREMGRCPSDEPRSPRIVRLAQELERLRQAVFESNEWADFYERDSARLKREGKKADQAEIDRAVFARIAQKTENEVLSVMRSYLVENGWTALTLCFDGLIIQHRPERELDLAALNRRIVEETQFEIEIVEKPLFSPDRFPTLSLVRS
jgi:hypothetical protein